jgi:hypothetical protein
LKGDKGIEKETKIHENSANKGKSKKEKNGNQIKPSSNKKKEVFWVEAKEDAYSKKNNCNNDKISAVESMS